MVTNGEFNVLCMRGNTRPLDVLQVRAEARKAVKAMNTRTLLAMLTPKGMYLYRGSLVDCLCVMYWSM